MPRQGPGEMGQDEAHLHGMEQEAFAGGGSVHVRREQVHATAAAGQTFRVSNRGSLLCDLLFLAPGFWEAAKSQKVQLKQKSWALLLWTTVRHWLVAAASWT